MAAGVLYPTLAQAGECNEQVAAQQQPRGMFIGTPEILLCQTHRQLARGDGDRSQAPP